MKTYWKDKYVEILKSLGFDTYNKITYYKSYHSEDKNCDFEIILVPCEDGFPKRCILNFNGDISGSGEFDVSLDHHNTYELYKDLTALIMMDIIDTNFEIREHCFEMK